MNAIACQLRAARVASHGDRRRLTVRHRTGAAQPNRACRRVSVRAEEDGSQEQVPKDFQKLPSNLSSRNKHYVENNYVATYETPIEDVLEIPDLRDKLTPQPSPLSVHNNWGGGFASDDDRVSLQSMKFASANSSGASTHLIATGSTGHGKQWMQATLDQMDVPLPAYCMRAGAREVIYHNPSEVTAAIVTCGGLCPGLNDVVAGLVKKLEDYGVPDGNILGIRYGYQGFYDPEHRPIVLNSKVVEGLHLQGGTMLGTSRGGADITEIVKRLDMMGVDMLFVVGGNGGNAGAAAIQAECRERDVICSVIGIPKSIDNDILLIDRCFGFETAVEEAQRPLLAAKVEASSAYRGVGVVKLMGRQSGFIAMEASMASGVVDLCLIPETKFSMDKVAAHVQSIIDKKGHAVICVAEGAGQDIMEDASSETDASGNPILGDIGTYMKTYLKQHLKEADIKYIDPTYMIRAIPTGAPDRVYCKALGQSAVHGAFAGFTDVSVGMVNTHMAILPIPVIIQAAKIVNVHGSSWNRLRQTIRQPDLI